MATSGLISGLIGGFSEASEQQEQAKEEKRQREAKARKEGLIAIYSNPDVTTEVKQAAFKDYLSLIGLVKGAKGEEQAENVSRIFAGIAGGAQERRAPTPAPAPQAPEAVTFADLPPSPLAQFEERVPGAPTQAVQPSLPPVPAAPKLFKTPEDKANEARAEAEAEARLNVWAEQFKTELQNENVQRNIEADAANVERALGRPPTAVEAVQILGKHLNIPGFGGPTGFQTVEDETPGAAIVDFDPGATDAFGRAIEPGTIYKTVSLPAGQGMAHFPKAASPSAAQEKLNLEIEAFKDEHPNITDAAARRGVLGERRKNIKLQLRERIERLRVTRLRNQIQEEIRSEGGLSEATARQILFHTRREAEALVDGNFENIGISATERVRQIDDAQKKLLSQGYGISRIRILSRLGLTKYKIGQTIIHKGEPHKVVGFTDDGNVKLKKVP